MNSAYGEGGAVGAWSRETVLALCFLVALAWAPFPYGSNRVWAELFLGVGLGAILLVWSAQTMVGADASAVRFRRLALPAFGAFAGLAWAMLQSTDLTILDRVINVDVNSIMHPIWAATAAALALEEVKFVAVDPSLARQTIFASALSIATFLIAVGIGRHRARAALLLQGVVVVACGYAAIAMIDLHFKVDLQSWLMREEKPGSNRITGPFINPNHLASYLLLGALASLALFVERFRQAVAWDRGMKVLVRTAGNSLASCSAWLATSTVIISSLLLTQSRAGVAALAIGTVGLSLGLSAGRRWGAADASGQRVTVAMLVAVVGIAVGISGDRLLGRVSESGVTDSSRASLAQSSVDAIVAAPVTGHGFGSFQRYFPIFADGTIAGDVDEAHNEYLETIADLGLLAGLLYIACPVLLGAMCVAGCVSRRRDRLYPAVGFASSLALGAQSFLEFSLQVPAVAITYSALLGIAIAQSWRKNEDLVR